jgi:ATP-dependent DNA helicase PIF1
MSAFLTFLKPITEGKNIYISGVGGTGKSYLLKELHAHFTAAGKTCFLTSTTGVSAFNIGGQTVHSWCSVVMPEKIPGDIPAWLAGKARGVKSRKKPYHRILTAEILFIDEISMLGSSYLEIVDWICKTLREKSAPFGGIQIVCSGDMLQLPPVNDGMPFISDVWKDLNFSYFTLEKRHRFPDPVFADLLSRARLGELTDADALMLNARVQKPPPSTTVVFPRRADVDRINSRECLRLKGIEYTLPAIIHEQTCTGQIRLTKIPPQISWPLEPTLKFKIGAEVMLLVNLDVAGGLVNGTRGIIQAINAETIKMKTDDGQIVEVARANFDIEDGDREFNFQQFPLTLAWAVTIHKVQGCTLDSACVDIGMKIFTAGQAYVALSRCRTLEGLYLTERVYKHRVFAEKIAVAFEKEMSQKTTFVDVAVTPDTVCCVCGKNFAEGETANRNAAGAHWHPDCAL